MKYVKKMKLKNTFKFCNSDINKTILLLRKGVYPYEYMDDWKKFNETTLPKKEEFYSNLNLAKTTDADDMHGFNFAKILKLKI